MERKSKAGSLTSHSVLLVALFVLLMAWAVVAVLWRQNVQISAIVFSTDAPVAGAPLVMTATLANRGWLPAQYPVVLLNESGVLDRAMVPLGRGESASVSFDLSGLPPGVHNLSIGGQKIELKLSRPAEFKVVGWQVAPANLQPGQSAFVRLSVENTGEVTGVYDEPLYFNGKPVASLSSPVAAGQTTVLEAELVVSLRGRHQVGAAGNRQEILVYQPADIILKDLVVMEKQIPAGTPVTAEAVLVNQGDLAGVHTAILQINGVRHSGKTVMLEAGQEKTVSFVFSLENSGAQILQIGNRSIVINVVQPTRPRNGALLNKSANSGHGRTTMSNRSLDQDALFVLASPQAPKDPLLAVYVHAGSKAKDIRLADGTYIVYYTTGQSFDAVSGRFLVEPHYYRLHDMISLETAKTGGAVQYAAWTIEIGQSNGNAAAKALQEDFFPVWQSE